jgi:hypothetical protein
MYYTQPLGYSCWQPNILAISGDDAPHNNWLTGTSQPNNVVRWFFPEVMRDTLNVLRG